VTAHAFLDVNLDFIPDMRHSRNISGIPHWSFPNNFFIKPKRVHKTARAIGGALLGADRWVRLRERLRSAILQKLRPMDPEIDSLHSPDP